MYDQVLDSAAIDGLVQLEDDAESVRVDRAAERHLRRDLLIVDVGHR